jgi:hypothetical protein
MDPQRPGRSRPPAPPPPGLPPTARPKHRLLLALGGLAVALIALLAILMLRDDEDPGYVGGWVATDAADASSMTLTITETEAGRYSLELHDDRVSVICPGEAATTRGLGTIQSGKLVSTMTGTCASGTPFDAGQVTFSHNPEADVLTDSVNPGTVWERG